MAVEPQNITFVYDNLVDTLATLTAEEAADGFPVTNLQDELRTTLWKCNDFGVGTHLKYLDVDFGSAKTITYLGLVEHNLIYGCKVRVQGNSSQSWSSPPFDETFNAPEIPGAEWSGVNVVQPALGHFLDYENHHSGDPGNPPAYRYWRITFDDTTNELLDHFSLARLFLGQYLQSPRNLISGLNHEVIDDSVVSRSEGGQPWTDEQNRRHQITFTIRNIAHADKVKFDLLFFQLGNAKDMIVHLEPDTLTGRILFSYYGRFHGKMAGKWNSYDNHAYKLTFRETP